FSRGWDAVQAIVPRAWRNMVSGARRGGATLISWTRSVPRALLRALGNVNGLLTNAGRNVMLGLWAGLQSMGGWVKSQLMALIKKIIPDPVEKILDIHSPSRVMKKIGQQIMQGLHAGLTSADADKVAAKMQQIAEKIRDAFKGKRTNLDDRLLAALKKNNTRLQGLAKERTKLLDKIAEAKEYAATITANYV
ncbi:hypothetical protein, partial [Actinomadura sp. RB99]|uniref:phage tail protein n=1 Tax=Actinomadura sp. RB99 TaxID=2691577 RepID=UPI0019D6A7E5